MGEAPNELSNPPYSDFSKVQKRWIVLLIAFAGMFSPMSSFIYYPVISPIARNLKVAVELVNLTITSYMIVSGVCPAIVGNLADMVGRRPIYLFTFFVYFAANVGLALQRSFPALLVLRMLQSVGSSGTISIAYGIIADIASPAERGSYVGAVLCGPNVAPSLGPVLGGVLAEKAGWPWIFWFLSMVSGFCLLALMIFLPETARSIVGNGSIPAAGIHRTLLSIFQHRHINPSGERSRISRLHIPNPFKCLVVLFNKDALLIILVNGIFYMTYCCIQASLSSLLIKIYHFTELNAGLVYLPFGFGCVISSYASGKIMNRDYRLTAKRYGFEVNVVKGDDLARFHIERARFRSVWYFVIIAAATITGYGWALDNRIHIAVPLVLQFFIGASTTAVFNMCGTLLTDLHPRNPATAQASSNLIRCALSASGLAALQVIIDHLGVGWTFTLFAGLCLLTIPMLLAEVCWGMQWRLARDMKMDDAAEERKVDGAAVAGGGVETGVEVAEGEIKVDDGVADGRGTSEVVVAEEEEEEIRICR